jgi:hypothetical protein
MSGHCAGVCTSGNIGCTLVHGSTRDIRRGEDGPKPLILMHFHGVLLGKQHAMWPKRHNGKVRSISLQRHFFSPLSLGAYDGRDTPGDCAVGPRLRRRGSPQSYMYAEAKRLRITGGAATPSALALFFPKRPFNCHRKKCASIVSNMWCRQPAYFRTS